MKTNTNIDTLLDEVLLLILTKSHPNDLSRFARTTKKNRELSLKDSLWKSNIHYYFQAILELPDIKKIMDENPNQNYREKFIAIYQRLFGKNKNEKWFQDLLFNNAATFKKTYSKDNLKQYRRFLTQTTDNLGFPIFFWLFVKGQVELLQKPVRQGIVKSVLTENDKKTILRKVIESGNFELFSFFIEQPEFSYLRDKSIFKVSYNANSFVTVSLGMIEYAAFCGHTEMVEKLLVLQNKKAIDIILGKANTPEETGLLQSICIGGHVEALQWLEEKYNTEKDKNGNKTFDELLIQNLISANTAFDIAATSLNIAILRFFIFDKKLSPFVSSNNLPTSKSPLDIFTNSYIQQSKDNQDQEKLTTVMSDFSELLDELCEKEQQENLGAHNNSLQFLTTARERITSEAMLGFYNTAPALTKGHELITTALINISPEEPATLEQRYPLTMKRLSLLSLAAGMLASLIAIAFIVYFELTVGDHVPAPVFGGLFAGVGCMLANLFYLQSNKSLWYTKLSQQLAKIIRSYNSSNNSEEAAYGLIKEQTTEPDIEMQDVDEDDSESSLSHSAYSSSELEEDDDSQNEIPIIKIETSSPHQEDEIPLTRHYKNSLKAAQVKLLFSTNEESSRKDDAESESKKSPGFGYRPAEQSEK